MKSKLGLKSRIFIDILEQVPFGSIKTTNKGNVSKVYTDELFDENI